MKWNEWVFTPHLCTYRLNWARRTSWGWWYEWGDTALQTHDSKLSPVGLRPSTLILVHGCYPQYSIFTAGQGGNILFLETWMPEQKTNLRSLTFQAGTRAPALWHCFYIYFTHYLITDIKMRCYVFLLVSISWLAKWFQLLIFMTMTLMMYYIG